MLHEVSMLNYLNFLFLYDQNFVCGLMVIPCQEFFLSQQTYVLVELHLNVLTLHSPLVLDLPGLFHQTHFILSCLASFLLFFALQVL